MGRWSQYDEDDYRLPEGMKRVGYDADTERYTFQGQNGDLWNGPPGSQYGELTRVASDSFKTSPSQGEPDDIGDLEASGPTRRNGYQLLAPGDGNAPPDPDSPYRIMLPFFLIVFAFLLLVIRLATSSTPGSANPTRPTCSPASRPYEVKLGDTCWAIAQTHGTSVNGLELLNPGVDCAKLDPGQAICIPLE